LAERIFFEHPARERFETVKTLCKTLYKVPKFIEQPDLLIYKLDSSEIRFAEAKRLDTRDELRESQIRGLALISILTGCQVHVFEVVEEGVDHTPQAVVWEF